MPLPTASDLFALSQTIPNQGAEFCHWCGSACERRIPHDDDPPVMGVRNKTTARRPGNPFVCRGCFRWRMPRQTVRFLDDSTFKDRQAPKDHSWWITEAGAWGIRLPADAKLLYSFLLKPPLRFALALREGPVDTHLHLTALNSHGEIKAETELHFTLNNLPLTFSVLELQEGVRHGPEGLLPGSRELLRLLGPFEAPPPPPAREEPRGRGRPPVDKDKLPIDPRKVVSK